MVKLTGLDWLALVLVIVGSLNIGIAALGFDVLDMIFGSIVWLAILVNLLIGLAALYLVYYLTKVR